jgi:hypothetical protein
MDTGRVVGVACAVCVALAACPLGRAQAADSWGREQMASGLDQLHRSSSTCVGNAVGVHVYEGMYDQGQIGALSLHSYAALTTRLCQSARSTVRRWTPTVFPPSGLEVNEAALVKRDLVDLQRCWLRAIDASGVYLRAVAAGRPTRPPFSALMRAYRTERAMELRLRTEWGL